MSKLKLLLLGGIFTLVGIFNFSSATEYYGTSYKCSVGENTEYNKCGDDILYFGEEVSEYTINVFSNDGDVSFFGNYLYSLPNGPAKENITNYPLKIECNENLCNGFNIWKWGSNFDGVVDISVILPGQEGGEGGEGGQVLLGGFSSLTPAITGLQDTINQIIPLLVYIGIGILLVILGFIAICWLVTWLVVKINNYFSSKRG